MANSARVLGPGCGPLDASLVFVGEAPGRLGADGSHLPFHGDKSGHNFEGLIEQVGISRYQVFVTNAVLCNPKDENGNNATPTSTEIGNCAPFLREQIEIVQPEIVVTLGAVALKACGLVEPHKLGLRESVRTSNSWFERKLIPAYHPGQRAMVHRSFANQLSDYQFIAESIRRASGPIRRSRAGLPRGDSKKLGEVARRVLESHPRGLSYFALHKLCFLADVAQLEATGTRLTNSYVVRQKDGPYFVDLHAAKLLALVPGLMLERISPTLRLRLASQGSFDGYEVPHMLSASELAIIDRVLQKYGGMSEAELKRVVYLSGPMRALLRKERAMRVNLFNAAVLPYTAKV